jgi:hypothetical protein
VRSEGTIPCFGSSVSNIPYSLYSGPTIPYYIRPVTNIPYSIHSGNPSPYSGSSANIISYSRLVYHATTYSNTVAITDVVVKRRRSKWLNILEISVCKKTRNLKHVLELQTCFDLSRPLSLPTNTYWLMLFKPISFNTVEILSKVQITLEVMDFVEAIQLI